MAFNITFEEFKNKLTALERYFSLLDDIFAACEEYNKDNKYTSEIYLPGLEDEVIDLLQILTNDRENDWIPYFMFDLDFGQKYKDGEIIGNNGDYIALATVEDLWNLLISEDEPKIIEILGSNNLGLAFDFLNITGKATYQGNKYWVWELNKKDFDTLKSVDDADWKDEWGWWRSADGCNISYYPQYSAKINGANITCWYDPNNLEDFIEFYKEDDRHEEATELDFFDQHSEYVKLTDYFIDMFGAGTERNVCALAVDLAKLNNMTMSDLFKVYEGV